MATVTATPCPFGVQMPATELASEREITEDLPSDVIGECVTEATQKAWRAGHDPALPPFVVLVTFR